MQKVYRIIETNTCVPSTQLPNPNFLLVAKRPPSKDDVIISVHFCYLYVHISLKTRFYMYYMKLGWRHIACIPLLILLTLYVRFIQAEECRWCFHLRGCQDSFQWTQVTTAMEAWWKQNLTPSGEMLKSDSTRFLRLKSKIPDMNSE